MQIVINQSIIILMVGTTICVQLGRGVVELWLENGRFCFGRLLWKVIVDLMVDVELRQKIRLTQSMMNL